MMTDKKIKSGIINEANRKLYKVIGYVKIAAFTAIIMSVFLLIWQGGVVPFKITASAIVIMGVCWFVKEVYDKAVGDYIDSKEIKDIRSKLNSEWASEKTTTSSTKKSSTSKFRDRLDELIEESRAEADKWK